jgi:hypothetical protein
VGCVVGGGGGARRVVKSRKIGKHGKAKAVKR